MRSAQVWNPPLDTHSAGVGMSDVVKDDRAVLMGGGSAPVVGTGGVELVGR
jgi:hypothetical protein